MSFLLCRQLYHCLVCVSHLCPSCCADSCIDAWFVGLICVLPVVQTALSLPGLCVSSLPSFLLCRQLYRCLVCGSQLCPSCCADSCIIAWFVCCRKCGHADHFPQPPARDQRPHPADAAPAAQDYFYHTGTASVVAHCIISSSPSHRCIISSSPSHRCIISLASPHMYSLACC